MSDPSLIADQRQLLHTLAEIAAEKARAEPTLARTFVAERVQADDARDDARDTCEKRYAAEKQRLDEELRQARAAIAARYTAEQEAIQKEYGKAKHELTTALEKAEEKIVADYQEASWTAEAVFEAARNDAETRLREETARLTAQMGDLNQLHEQGRALLETWRQPAADLEDEAELRARAKPRQVGSLLEGVQQVSDLLARLHALTLPAYTGRKLVGLGLLVWLLLIYPLGRFAAGYLPAAADADTAPAENLRLVLGLGIAASAIVSAVLVAVAYVILRALVRKRVAALYLPLCETLYAAAAARQQIHGRLQQEHDQAQRDAKARFEQDRDKAEARRARKQADVAARRATGFAPLEERLQARLKVSEHRRATDTKTADERHKQGHAAAERTCTETRRQTEAEHRRRVEEIAARHDREWRGLVDKWTRGLDEARHLAAAVNDETRRLFPPWDDPAWRAWQPPALATGAAPLPPAMRLGMFQVRSESVVAVPPWQKERPAAEPVELPLPALAAFPEPESLFYHVRDDACNRAIESLRMVMFRLLTTIPPGRVRFLIVDPVGLGQNFAAFMNLADFDEALVGSRIWTESSHIEQRLADVTAHMENVIQKYLRNRYATITEYNAHAGEVAEPYRVVVVANFPVNFTAEATRRLVSIAQSGSKCGVSTLVSIDTRQPFPKGFELSDLEACGANLVYDDGAFRHRDPDFGPYPVTLDPPPADELCNRVLQQVGEAARGAQRVEVPFEFIAPEAERYWSASAGGGISVALGRAGATRRQLLELGKGTSQHALVAGKTGSGKSTLLHALITNLSLLYDPDEVELYLVDFKKGVEFKTYAIHELPHARVVAIESEREFGLSVLQRLDAELKLRGERFRAVNAQDLNGYRQAAPGARAPRVLLIVDEFQEFFVEDDKIAQEAAQLLDRLVRQGRAFGIHILLGSQTLGGAYSLARSTIDQMAVRIALQCSEADAHLILSDDNAAARLLSRPGEAIYNDANGLVEGNDPFQVVWLGEAQREKYLHRVRELAGQRWAGRALPMVVFEGNADADVTRNAPLTTQLTAAPVDDAVHADGERAWLGEAMAIDELTAAPFRRQNGSNLLIVGQQPEAALGMFVTSVVSLAAQARSDGELLPLPRFSVIDGHQADAPRGGVLPRLSELLPEPVRLGGWRQLGGVLTELCGELDRRLKEGADEAPSLYLLLYGLHRMRDLRRSEDDFGFSSRNDGAALTPEKQLGLLLREGAAVGIHTLMWCDTMNNLQRAFDRTTLREVGMRVVFQMSVADSSNLIDTPAASKLGLHRALFASEEEGRLEKFRPYGVPDERWLAWAGEQLRRHRPAPPAAVPERG